MKTGISWPNPFEFVRACFNSSKAEPIDLSSKPTAPEVTIDIPSLGNKADGLRLGRFADGHSAWNAAKLAATQIPGNFGRNSALAEFDGVFFAQPLPPEEVFRDQSETTPHFRSLLRVRAGKSDGGMAEVLFSSDGTPSGLLFAPGEFHPEINDFVVTNLKSATAIPVVDCKAHNTWQGYSFDQILHRPVKELSADGAEYHEHAIPLRIFPSTGDKVLVYIADPGQDTDLGSASLNNFAKELSRSNISVVVVGARHFDPSVDLEVEHQRDIQTVLGLAKQLAGRKDEDRQNTFCASKSPQLVLMLGDSTAPTLALGLEEFGVNEVVAMGSFSGEGEATLSEHFRELNDFLKEFDQEAFGDPVSHLPPIAERIYWQKIGDAY